MSNHPVSVSREYANDKQQDDNQRITAYAKLAGRDWTYYVRDQSINIGRPPDERQPQANGMGASSPMSDMKDMLPVHIDLGPSKIVSRHHASVFYDAEFPEGGGWHVRVNGRNGVRVNNVLLKRGSRQQVTSGTVLEVSGTQMMFVTPGDPVQIDQYFIDNAKKPVGDETAATIEGYSDRSGIMQPTPTYQHQLAPPPPMQVKQERASTPPPPQVDMRHQRAVFDSKTSMSPMYGRGMMLESTQEIDYSRDSAKDLKPPFSYATMIAQAIFSTDEEKMTLANIYSFIADKYAFYRFSNSGWQNSIRHNLSLNKAFQKVPRRTDEPGKGMKWMIAPEHRQEYWKKQAKRHGGSAPSSPASSKEVNPNFRGPNGQNLGYDTTMVTSFSSRDNAPVHGGNRLSFQPPPPTNIAHFAPVPNLAPPTQPQQETFTPQRRRTDTGATLPESTFDDSPLPNRNRATPHPNGPPIYTLPSSVPPAQRSPTNPTLSSSYLDTPFHKSQHSSIITPAPMRQNPRLAPPSTLVAPSKFMPESSPAGPGLFWKGMMGATPGTAVPDMSPVKVDDDHHHNSRNINGRALDSEADRQVMSSSPPPMDTMGSPSKPARGSQLPFTSSSARKERDGEDRSRSASATVSAQGVGQANRSAGTTPVLQHSGFNANAKALNYSNEIADGPEDDDDGGFDLAKGFAPIARGMSQGIRR